MKKKRAEGKRERLSNAPTGVVEVEGEMESATPTATAVAGEALATGVVPLAGAPRRQEIPGRGAESLKQGDPDVRELGNAFVGDEGVGGDMPTPDQSGVDDIGKAMGVVEVDAGALRSSSEILDERDQRTHGVAAKGSRKI